MLFRSIGTPLAGLVFGIEMVFSGPIRAMAILESLIACLFAMMTAHLLGTPHSRFPPLEAFVFEWHLPFFAASAGLLFGMIARLFLFLEHVLEQIFGLIFRKPTVRGFAGGLLLLILFQLPGTLRYSGLGIESIQEAFRWPSSILDPFAKTGFTALSLASGFKGGEFVPLVFMGSTLGSALAGMIGLSVSFFAALGFASVFGAASKTPLACAVMAAEIFGWKLFPYAWIS